MSQAGDISAISGPVSPGVFTTLLTDNHETFDYTVGTGVSTTANNTISLFGDNGIQVYTDDVDTSVNQIRFSRGEVITSDATETTLLQFTVLNNTCLTFQVIVSAFCTAGTSANSCAGGYTTATVKNVAGVASIVGTFDFFKNLDVALSASDITIDTSGANFRIRVKGQAGDTIQWNACTPGIIST